MTKHKHCEQCENCQYIGEGDFICDRRIAEPDKALVIEDWSPTENFLQCKMPTWQIKRALEQLGYKRPKFKVEQITENRYSVILDNKYFGVYDTTRKTFVY